MQDKEEQPECRAGRQSDCRRPQAERLPGSAGAHDRCDGCRAQGCGGTAPLGLAATTIGYGSGRKGECFLRGVSPRKQSLSVYVMSGLRCHARILEKPGKHRAGKSCLDIRRLDGIDLTVLQELPEESVEHLSKMYPSV